VNLRHFDCARYDFTSYTVWFVPLHSPGIHVACGLFQVLQSEMAKVVGAPVRQRAGNLETKGHHTAAVRNWLVGLGF